MALIDSNARSYAISMTSLSLILASADRLRVKIFRRILFGLRSIVTLGCSNYIRSCTPVHSVRLVE